MDVLFINFFSYPSNVSGILIIWDNSNIPLAYSFLKSIGYTVNNYIPLVTNRKRPVFKEQKNGPVTNFVSILLFSSEEIDTNDFGWFSMLSEETLNFPFVVCYQHSFLIF